MWTKPGYTPTETAAPQEQGERLATFPRGRDAELRVSLDSYNGNEFVSARLWERGHDGASWWPTKKGVTVRLRECGGLAEVLARVATEHGGPDRRRASQERPGEAAGRSADDRGVAPAGRPGATAEAPTVPPWETRYVDKGRRREPRPVDVPPSEARAGFDEFEGR